MANKWQYLYIEVENKGRTIFENGNISRSHTKKLDLSPLPKELWNTKGKEMTHEAKGNLLSAYGEKGWELVAAKFGEGVENTYIFKKEI